MANILHKLGFAGPSRCVLCKHDSEDDDHLLYSFLYSQVYWEWLRQMLGFSSPFPNSLSNLLKGWPTNLCKGIYRKIWNTSPSIPMWEIWKERNRQIFCDSKLKSEDLILKIEASIVKIAISHLRRSRIDEGSFTIWDGVIKKVWTKLINPPLVYLKKRKEAREQCKWIPPLKD